MSINHTIQDMNTNEPSSIEACGENTLAKLDALLTGTLEATIGERNSEGYYEVHVLPDPDPDSGVHLVMLLSDDNELFHAATFDIDDLGEAGTNTALLGL